MAKVPTGIIYCTPPIIPPNIGDKVSPNAPEFAYIKIANRILTSIIITTAASKLIPLLFLFLPLFFEPFFLPRFAKIYSLQFHFFYLYNIIITIFKKQQKIINHLKFFWINSRFFGYNN